MAKSKSTVPAPAESESTVEPTGADSPDPMGRTWTIALGVYLVGVAALSSGWLVSIWGGLQAGMGESSSSAASGFVRSLRGIDVDLFAAAILAGAVGSLLHAIQSFTMYIAHRRLYRRWLAWYLLRPVVGAMIASMLFLVIRGGFLTTGKDAVSLNALIALAAVGGMFSEPATKRLSEVAYAVFGTTRDRNDALKDGESERASSSKD